MKSFKIKYIIFNGVVTYSFQEISAKSIFHSTDKKGVLNLKQYDNFQLSISDKPNEQILQISMSNVCDRASSDELVYIPAYKNVIFEHKENTCIAIYFVILNLVKPEMSSGTMKLLRK